jgi:hypothetical protein
MGYNTQYQLQTHPPTERERVHQIIVAMCDGFDPFGDECKWYEHDKDARAASLVAANVIIQITGDGEEQGDEWVLYALNGETVKHKREEWKAPPPSAAWLKIADSSQAQTEREAAAVREKELAELARLKAKYERQARPK